MLTRPNDSDGSGRGLMAMTFPPPPLADGDKGTQTGVLSSAPAWSSSSSPPSFSSITVSPSCCPWASALPSPPPISSTSPSAVSVASPSTDSSSLPVFPRHTVKSSSSSAVSPSPVFLSSSSSHVSLPSSSPAVPPSHSTQCPDLLPSQLLYSCSSSVSPVPSESPLSSAESTVHHSTLISPPPPPPAVSTPCASPTAAVYAPSSSSTPPASSSVLYPPASLSHTAPVLPPAPPCCSCSTLLPRLLSAHRLEVRRLLRGALATLSRRLDSLERRSMRKKRSRQTAEEGGRATCSRESATSPLSTSFTDQEEEEEEEKERGTHRKRRKKQRDINHGFKNREDKEAEEEEGRFVVRMAVSLVGAEEGAPLILHNLNHRRRADRESTALTVFRPNGFTTPPLLLHSISSSSSQRSLHVLQPAHSSPSDTLEVSSGRWRFSNILLPFNILSNHRAVHQWLSPSPLSYTRHTLLLKLSAVAAEVILESVRGGARGNPLRPLKDWTAPPSLSTDHCYMRTLFLSSASDVARQQKQRNNHRLHLAQRRPLPLSSSSPNGPSAALPNVQTLPASVGQSTKERGKRVSQIRIRRAPPRETSLTPMGLPKVKRLKKKEFSLEEIYTNKNYKSPTGNRTLETIFEEPREKDGALLRIGHQKRRRLLLFPDFTQPRKRKRPSGIGLPVASMPKKRVASRRYHGSNPVEDESDVDVMLVERLSALEDFLTQQGLDV